MTDPNILIMTPGVQKFFEEVNTAVDQIEFIRAMRQAFGVAVNKDCFDFLYQNKKFFAESNGSGLTLKLPEEIK